SLCGAGRMRTGSLQFSSTPVSNLSLKRTKRKAPSPPSKMPLHPDEESSRVIDSVSEANSPEELSSTDFTLAETSLGPGLPSHEQCTVATRPDETSLSDCPGTPEAAVASLTSGISSDYSLEEIDEKEELSEGPKNADENISLKSQDIPFGSTNIINTLKNAPDSALGNDTKESSKNSKEEKQEIRNTDGLGPHIIVHDTSTEKKVVDSVINLKSSDPNQENGQSEIIVSATNTKDNVENGVRTEINVGGVTKNNVDVEVDRLPNYQAHKADSVRSYKENHLSTLSAPDQKPNQFSVDKTKKQDVAIQTTSSCNSFDGNQHHNLSHFKVDESVQASSNNKSTQLSSLSPQDCLDTTRQFRNQSPLILHSEDQLTMKDPICVQGNDDLLSPVDGIDKQSNTSFIKNYPIYRQDYNPKPKPSNEITREYIPKIGMTTYKIVPPKSMDLLNDWESETTVCKGDQEIHTQGEKNTHENVKETAIQIDDPVISESPKEPLADMKHRPTQKTEHPVHSMENTYQNTMADPLKPAPRIMRDTVTAPFAPNLEDINNILESKIRSRISNPQAKPSSFFLQMQKRASGHYVTSAAAKSVHTLPNPTPKEPTNKEVEKDPLPTPEQTLPPLSKAIPSPQHHIKNTDDNISRWKPTGTSPPPVAPKPVPLPSSQSSVLNMKTLKTFGAPRPYSSSAPSPFALAVVKRSQSFSKAHTVSCSDSASAQPLTDTEGGKTPSVTKRVETPQLGGSDKENNSAHSEQNSQIPFSTDCPSFTLKRQSSLTFQSSDPEQIWQSLLTSIRSGEAAANLKR
ncbi:Cordon-bleu protein-like 1, partial [Galemys pyrenaicus]